MATSDRWHVRNDRRLPIGQVAAETLRTRLDAVWDELRAAGSDTVAPEHVHGLRVATRRTLAAFDAFASLIPAKRRAWFEKRLRRLRRVAGDARDLDVLTDRLNQDGAARARSRLIAMLSKQRVTSRLPIREQFERLVEQDWPSRVERLVASVRGRRRRAGYRTFARRRLKPMVDAFFARADRRLRDGGDMHAVRIEGKKLRYALEIFAAALPPRGRDRCEQALERLQRTLGRFTDHAAAADRLRRWARGTDAGPNHDLLVSLCAEERRQAARARKAFSRWWNPARRRTLRRRFERTLRRTA